MQRLVNFIDDLRTTLAVEEEELKSLLQRINTYTYVGSEDPLDQAEQVSACEGEAECNSQNETEGCQEKQHEQKSDRELSLNPERSAPPGGKYPLRVPCSKKGTPNSPNTVKRANGHVRIEAIATQSRRDSFDSRDDFLGRKFGEYQKYREKLQEERKQDFKDFLERQKSQNAKTTKTKPKTPLKSSEAISSKARKSLFQQLQVTPPSVSNASSPAHLQEENIFMKLVDRDSKKNSLDTQLKYKEELLEQIREKKLREAQLREKEKQADEKLDLQIEEQRRRMRSEYENEMQRIKRKSLSQPNLTAVGSTTAMNRRDRELTSPSYVQLKELARARNTKSPMQFNGGGRGGQCEPSSSSKGALKGKRASTEILRVPDPRGRKGPSSSNSGRRLASSPAEVTFRPSEAIRKAIPLIPSVKKNLAEQQHRLQVKLAALKKHGPSKHRIAATAI